ALTGCSRQSQTHCLSGEMPGVRADLLWMPKRLVDEPGQNRRSETGRAPPRWTSSSQSLLRAKVRGLEETQKPPARASMRRIMELLSEAAQHSRGIDSVSLRPPDLPQRTALCSVLVPARGPLQNRLRR